MVNVIIHKEDRKALEKRGYCFLEEKDYICLKNKYYETICEIVYNDIMEQFVIFTADAVYFCEHEIIIQPLRDGIIVCMNYRNSSDSQILKVEAESGKLRKQEDKTIVFHESII